jgi:hypothetical protein
LLIRLRSRLSTFGIASPVTPPSMLSAAFAIRELRNKGGICARKAAKNGLFLTQNIFFLHFLTTRSRTCRCY